LWLVSANLGLTERAFLCLMIFETDFPLTARSFLNTCDARGRRLIPVFRRALILLQVQDPIRLGAATAFFTIFALPPILILLIRLFSIVFNQAIVSGSVFKHLSQLVGKNSAMQVQDILINFQRLESNWLITVFLMVFLLFVSTTLFVVVQHSINQVWSIKNRKGYDYRKVLLDRVISVAIILTSGILFMATVLFDSLLSLINGLLKDYHHEIDIFWIQAVSTLISTALVTLWLAILFRYLPHARIAWPAIWRGAAVSAILFTIGQVLMGHLLINSNLGSLYGAAASIVLLLLFVFYSSFALYYGAAFVKAYAEGNGYPVKPHSYAVRYRITELQD
jgi:membrane protein